MSSSKHCDNEIIKLDDDFNFYIKDIKEINLDVMDLSKLISGED